MVEVQPVPLKNTGLFIYGAEKLGKVVLLELKNSGGYGSFKLVAEIQGSNLRES